MSGKKEGNKRDIFENIYKFINENNRRDEEILVSGGESGKEESAALIKPKENLWGNENDVKKEEDNSGQKLYQTTSGISDSLMLNNNISDIIGLSLENSEMKKTIKMMREMISDLKNQIAQNELKFKEDLNNELNRQKFDFDNEKQRLKDLVQTLISEKQNLSDQIRDLNEKMLNLEQKHKTKVEKMIENYEDDTKKNKDAWFQAEKMRRKKWEEAKIKEIKEMTVKSLEPELDKILNDHKKELYVQEEKLKDKFRVIKEKIISDYEDKISRMKNQFIKEKEELQESERKSYIKRLREQNLRMEDQHISDQKKWYLSLQDEIKRLEKMREIDRKNYEDDIKKLEEKHADLVEENESSYKKIVEKLERAQQEKYDKFTAEEREKLKVENEKYLKLKELE